MTKEYEEASKEAERIAKLYYDELYNNASVVILKHNSYISACYEEDKKKFWEMMYELIMDFSFIISKRFDEETKQLNRPVEVYTGHHCGECDELVRIIFGNHYIEDNGKCCEKVGDYSFDINVPSGKLVFCDWPEVGGDKLQEMEETFEGAKVSINSRKGRYLKSKGYAKNDIIHFFVGSIGPDVLQKGNTIYIERSHEDTPDGLVDRGHICTDLWWVTGFDLEVYKKILSPDEYAEFIKMDGYTAYVTVDVEPGTYRCSYNSQRESDDFIRYLTIQKI